MGRNFDYVLVNNGKIPEYAYKRYLKDGEHLFMDDLESSSKRVVVKTDLVANSLIKKDKGDELVRSLVRHDSEKLSKELYKIFRKGWKSTLHFFLSLYR